ncbi:LacI family DNA-binding transcriptional regulator [Xylanimonas sp. McL0601]|uniref:LacI family DNA-binding transcriptional regulator n=1 Tax=Xylanimonas sp. McL0601 TaxID=3414739 RepID=UPI003CEDD036
MARIKDVAQLAGVSTATVSRVLNGIVVRSDLAEKVHGAIDELGYVPDRTARSLRRRHSDVIALVLPDIENPFFTSLARGVEDVAKVAGYSVVLCNTDDLHEKEREYLRVAEVENMAGVIIAPASDDPALAGLLERRRGVVVLDRRISAQVDQVTFDNVRLGRALTEGLVARGFRRIACVTGPATTSTAVDRAQGWHEALSAAGCDAPDELLVHANFRVDGGYDALLQLLELPEPPDAVLATNNLVGVGVLRALADVHGRPTAGPAETGWVDLGGGDAVRGDAGTGPRLGVAVIGELPFATSRTADVLLWPLNPRALGTAAATMLLERIAGLDVPPRHVEKGVPGLDGEV